MGHMRVCLVTNEYPPQSAAGGIGSYCSDLAAGLSARGNHVHVVCPGEWSEGVEELASNVTVHRIPVVQKHLLMRLYNKMRTINSRLWRTYRLGTECVVWSFAAARYVAALSRRVPVDIVECPEILAQGFWLAGVKARPLVIKLHTPYEMHRRLNGYCVGSDVERVSQLEYAAVRRANRVTSCSRALVGEVEKLWRASVEAITIPNPVDVLKFLPMDSLEEPRKVVIGYVGRLEPRKGVDVLWEAYKGIASCRDDVELWCVGADQPMPQGGMSWGGWMQQEASALGLTGVRLMGTRPREQLPSLYNGFSVCVVPSRGFENLPYTCLEAMSCGRPVVASDCGGIPEIVTNGVDGVLFRSGDHNELATLLLGLLDSPEMRARIGRNARTRIESGYSMETVLEKTLTTYRGVIAEARGVVA